MSDSENNSRSSHRSKQSSRSDEMLKIIEEMNKEQKEFREVVSSSIRELSSKVKVMKEEIQKSKSKTRSGSQQCFQSRRTRFSAPDEVGPIVGFESMIESDKVSGQGI